MDSALVSELVTLWKKDRDEFRMRVSTLSVNVQPPEIEDSSTETTRTSLTLVKTLKYVMDEWPELEGWFSQTLLGGQARAFNWNLEHLAAYYCGIAIRHNCPIPPVAEVICKESIFNTLKKGSRKKESKPFSRKIDKIWQDRLKDWKTYQTKNQYPTYDFLPYYPPIGSEEVYTLAFKNAVGEFVGFYLLMGENSTIPIQQAYTEYMIAYAEKNWIKKTKSGNITLADKLSSELEEKYLNQFSRDVKKI